MSNLCDEDTMKFFENYDRIIEALAGKRFIAVKYQGLVIHIFKGIKRDHIVAPCRLCTCEDFIVNYVGRNRSIPCYHVVGFKIAEKYGKLVELEVDLMTMTKILEEIVFEGVSSTLRKLLKFS